jgi:hypothetical protein
MIMGEYDDIDMRGLRREWYENNIPSEWQDALKGFGTELRFIWNQVTHRPCIIVKSPGCDTLYHGGFMFGWAIVMHCDKTPFSATYYRHLISQMKRLEDYENAEAMEAEMDKEIMAGKAVKQANRDKELNDFVESEYPKGLLQERAIVRDGERKDAAAANEASTLVKRRKRRGKISTG